MRIGIQHEDQMIEPRFPIGDLKTGDWFIDGFFVGIIVNPRPLPRKPWEQVNALMFCEQSPAPVFHYYYPDAGVRRTRPHSIQITLPPRPY